MPVATRNTDIVVSHGTDDAGHMGSMEAGVIGVIAGILCVTVNAILIG